MLAFIGNGRTFTDKKRIQLAEIRTDVWLFSYIDYTFASITFTVTLQFYSKVQSICRR